jgi:hypothetical protein
MAPSKKTAKEPKVERAEGKVNPDMSRPVKDNVRHLEKEKPARNQMGIHPSHGDVRAHGGVSQAGKSVFEGGQVASSLPGALGIIDPCTDKGTNMTMTIPGIISTTTESPINRQRMLGGIIESPMKRDAPAGPVHTAMGYDATAYNAGMKHIPGSPFR